MNDGEIGAQIRRRRVQAGLSLSALAARSGVSRAMLSEVERGAKNPTIKVACQIAAALACTVSELLEEPTPAAFVLLRRDEQRVLNDARSGVERRQLSPALLRRGIELLRYTIPPRQETDVFPPHRPGVIEQITVLEGALQCRLGERAVRLEAGDALSFQADLPHAFASDGDVACVYILLIDQSDGLHGGAARDA